MSTQSESILEENLLKQLELQEYERVVIKDDKALEENLKTQLEKHNKTTISDIEFKRVLNHLNKGKVFEKAKILRDKFNLQRDDGTTKYIEFLDSEHWCQNIFQVTTQVTVEGVYKNRYDVTILINGFPLVQIELKRRGLELKEAFNQTLRYKRQSYSANNALFNYIQLFVISNGVNTKYYANNKLESMNFEQTFYWGDELNKRIDLLDEFTDTFLERCHLSKMICKYIVLAQVPKMLMILRPYQFWAVESIIDRVNNTDKNGYIWHTTGSGKTLTSFKTAQILMKLPKVSKVIFVVDRKDLDFQTTKEFNSFSDGSVDGTDNTLSLVKQFSDDTKLIVTTIQKLNTAISKKQYLHSMEKQKDKNIVFIFDECHRSQFGDTHKAIVSFFTKAQMIGFTGTPIFEKNSTYKKTTLDLFDKRLHSYVITDAINDKNVLKFSIEYIGRYKDKVNSTTNIDIEVEDIDTKELLESEKRVDKIVDYIIANHDRKTKSKMFTAMMCVSSVDMLIKYYENFKSKNHNLKIATIFSYGTNEDDKDATGFIELEEEIEKEIDISFDFPNTNTNEHINKHSREKLDEFIEDYNKMFNTKYSTKDSKSYYNYYNELSKRVKEKEIDILLVVNMFLTGFDSKPLNTLYVDKNLKYHGLIQAFSRTNRILNENKSQGNIVCFRNLKDATDDSIRLFSNIEAKEVIVMNSYEEYLEEFNKAYLELLSIAPDIQSISDIKDDNEKLAFVKAFRELIRTKNILDVFSDFKWADLLMKSQDFEDYKSKYLDMKETNTKEKVSILNDVDFELELIRRDDINVSYILSLLADFKNSNDEDKKKQKENINNIINGNTSLRSKRELIEKFINENLTQMKDDKSIDEEFGKFWNIEKDIAYEVLCKDENLDCDEVRKVVDKYIYEQRKPLKTDIAKTLKVKPKLLERKEIVPRVLGKIVDFVDKFYDDIGVDLNSNINNLDYNNEEEILIVAEDKVPYGKDK